jgi:adenylate cyclase
MPHVETVSETDLAARAGTTPEEIKRLSELGIVSAEPDGSYRLGNLQRIQLAESLERGGVPLDAVGKAIAEGKLSFSFLELATNPAPYSPKTYREAADEMGWTVDFIQQMHEALGLARPEPDDRVREDDLEIFAGGQFARQLGMSDAQVCRSLRLYGDNLARIGAAEAPFFHEYVETPLLRSGMSEYEMLEAASQLSPQIRPMVERTMLWVYRRHQEHATIEHIVEHVENLLEEAGLAIQAVLCSMDLVERTPSAGLPPAHVGVNAGPVIFRDGDYFGRTVNVAARIAAQAGPGDVLVSDDVVALASGDGLRFERIGPVDLKGLSKPMVLHRVSKGGR